MRCYKYPSRPPPSPSLPRMCFPTDAQEYIDPQSICCVVLDEAHHCGKEHPFNRVSKQFLVPAKGAGAIVAAIAAAAAKDGGARTGAGASSASAPVSVRKKSPSAFPKVRKWFEISVDVV